VASVPTDPITDAGDPLGGRLSPRRVIQLPSGVSATGVDRGRYSR
jgi:hypothetical protein